MAVVRFENPTWVVDAINEEIKVFLDGRELQRKAQEKGRDDAILATLEALETSVRSLSTQVALDIREAPTKTVIENLSYCLDLARELEDRFTTKERDKWLRRLASEYERFTNAIADALQLTRVADALTLVGALGTFWFFTTRYLEGLKWIELVLKYSDVDSTSMARAKALFAAGMLYRALGNLDKAREAFSNSKIILEYYLGSGKAENKDDTMRYYAFGLALLGLTERDIPRETQGPDGGMDFVYIEQSLRCFEAYKGSQWARWGEALAHTYLGMAKLRAARDAMKQPAFSSEVATLLHESIQELDLSLKMFRHVFPKGHGDRGDYWGITQAMIYKGVTLHQCALYEASLKNERAMQSYETKARVQFQVYLQFLKLHLQGSMSDLADSMDPEHAFFSGASVESKRGLARCLCGLAAVANNEGRPETALKLLGAAEKIRTDLGALLVLNDIMGYMETFKVAYTHARQQVNARDAYLLGETMTTTEAINYALRFALPVVFIRLVSGHSEVEGTACEICGTSTLWSTTYQQYWTTSLTFASELPTYVCYGCGAESADLVAYLEFLSKVREAIVPGEDPSAAKELDAHIAVARRHQQVIEVSMPGDTMHSQTV